MTENIWDDPDKLPKKDEDVRLVLDNYWRSKNELVTDTYVEKCKTFHKVYRAIVEESGEEVDELITTDLVVPLVFAHIESIHPRLVANNPRVETWGRGREDAIRAAQMRALMRYYWDALNLRLFLLDLNKLALITGTAWAKVYWKKETRRRKEVRMESPSFMGFPVPGIPPRRVEEIVDAVVHDLPQVDLLDNDEVFPDPDGYSEDTCEWIIHRSTASLGDVLAAGDFYDEKAVRKLEERVKAGNPKSDAGDQTIHDEMMLEVGGEAQAQPDPHKRQFHLLERWDNERVIIVVEEFKDLPPLKKEYHGIGSKPFVRYTPIPVPRKIFGIGMAEILYPYVLEVSSLHQARIDNVKHVVHRMMTVRMGSQINPAQLVRRPGGWVDVIDHDDIRPLDTGEVHFSAYREIEALSLEAQRTSGANDIVQGVGGSGSGNTATQAQLLAEATASRTTLMFKILSEQFLTPLGRLLIRLTDMHMTTAKVVRIAGSEFSDVAFQSGQEQDPAGPGFLTVTPESLSGGSGADLDLVIDIAEADPEVRVTRQQRAINALTTLGNIYPPNHPVMERFTEMLLEGFGEDRPRALLEQGRPFLAQLQAQQAAQSGAQTPGDQLAIDASAGAPTGDRQVPSGVG